MTLNEVGVIGDGNNTYCKANKICDEIIDENTEYTKRLGFKILEKEKALPIMYSIPKMHKNPTGVRFITASKIYSTKQISKYVSNDFKLVYPQIENLEFLSNYNKFWVLQNSDLIIQPLNDIKSTFIGLSDNGAAC